MNRNNLISVNVEREIRLISEIKLVYWAGPWSSGKQWWTRLTWSWLCIRSQLFFLITLKPRVE